MGLKMSLSRLAWSGRTAGAVLYLAVQFGITMTLFKCHILMCHEEGIKLLNLPTTHQMLFRAPALDSVFLKVLTLQNFHPSPLRADFSV